MTEPAAEPDSAPKTGEAAVDDALARLSDLRSVPVSEHHDRLARAHDALHQALHPAEGGTPDGHGQEPARS